MTTSVKTFNPVIILDAIAMKERLMSKIKTINGCWVWQGVKRKGGYGRIRINGKIFTTSRVSYELFVGHIPEGLFVCHTCDNPPCIRPDHLFLATHQENDQDKANKGRAKYGEQHWNAKLTTSEVVAIKLALKDYHFGLYKELALKYHVSERLIYCIRYGSRWSRI
jgi:hypothetical protein